MNTSFEKLVKFDIDCKRLQDEWVYVANKNRLFDRASTYLLLLITYPSSYNDDIDIVDFQNQIGVNKFFNISSEFSSLQIVRDFQKTYTHEVVLAVSEYVSNAFPNYCTSIIKYAAQAPNCRMRIHTDDHISSQLPRLLLTVDTRVGCFMQVENELHTLDDNGVLFLLDRTKLHAPINQSDNYRLLMHFDLKYK